MSKASADWGVIEYQHCIVCWFLVDEWMPVTEDYAHGGTMTRQARTGRKVLEARFLGSETLLDVTPELGAAVETDRTRVKQ